MRIEHTTELYSENQRERWSSHQWYFLYKIITFFDVLLLVTKATQRQTKPQEEVEKKTKKAKKGKKLMSQDKSRVIPENATTKLCHWLEDIISRNTQCNVTPL